MELVKLKIVKKAENPIFVGNNYLGIELEGKIHNTGAINFKLKNYSNWFNIPKELVEIIRP